jgi:hypothetical protein
METLLQLVHLKVMLVVMVPLDQLQQVVVEVVLVPLVLMHLDLL